MIPEIDGLVGMSVYSTPFEGIGGSIKNTPEDFAVTEVINKRALERIGPERGYAVYVLKKNGIDTNHAIRQIGRRTGLHLKPLGLKDAMAVTEQYVCATGRGRSVAEFSADRFSIRRLGFVPRPLSKKDMTANRFSIRVSGARSPVSGFGEFGRILNFFGYQRFGSHRPVSHLIGRALVRQDFESAVDLLLCFTSKYDTDAHNAARKGLAENSHAESLKVIPPGMDLERIVLSEMARHGDSRRAFCALPVAMRRFFVQAYQSFLFNLTLCAMWGKEDVSARKGDVCYADGVLGKYSGSMGQRLAVPLVGYSYYKKTRFHRYISDIMESQQVRPADFFIKEMQEASSEGGFRDALIRCGDVVAGKNTIEFTLSRGSFATVIMREIIKPREPTLCGF